MDARELDIVRVVGKKEPVPVFEVLDFKNELSGPMTDVLEHYQKGLSCFTHNFLNSKDRDILALISVLLQGSTTR